MIEPVRVDFNLVGRVYDAMHPNGWRWKQLTSGEANASAQRIKPVLDALYDAGFTITAQKVIHQRLEAATTLELLEAACARLPHQQACEVAALAFRLPEDVPSGVGG